jgi:vitamin B12 transporter
MLTKRKTRFSFISLVLPAITCASLLTAEEELPIYDLGKFVVVSTRTPLSLDRASPSVSLITNNEMELWQDRSFAEAISRTPGLVLWSNGSMGSLTSLSTRGTESNHTGFFLDGRRLNPGFGNQYDLGLLSLDNLESIEVQKGASTVNYGSSGIGGVINARLKSALDVTEPETSVHAEAGPNDYRKAGLNTAVGTETIGFSLSASTLSTDNERGNDGYEKMNLASRLDWKLNDQFYFELLGAFFDAEKELPGSELSPTPFDLEQTTNWLVSPGLRYLTDELSVHLFYARSERNADIFEVNSAFNYSVFPAIYLGDFPISNEIDITGDEVDLQLDYSLSDDALLTVGAVYRNDEARNTNLFTSSPLAPAVPYEESFQQWGTYALLAWQLSETFEMRGGLRYDDYSEYDDEITGNFSLIYKLADWDAALFAKVASSYAPPSAVDLAYDSDLSTPLSAEESFSYEMGFRQSLLGGGLTYSLLFFRNEIDELLSYEPSTFDTFNIEEAVTQGAEVSVEYQASEKLMLGLGYTYLIAESDRLNDPRTGGFIADPADGVPLARRPEHLLQFSAFYAFTDSLSAGLQVIGQFDREDIDPGTFLQVPAEDFLVLRLVADWEINETWSIYGRVENLLDETYASAAGYPTLGRAGYLGVKYNF